MYSNRIYQNDLEEIINVELPFNNFEGKNILVTGGNGLIGSYLTDSLIYLRENKNIKLNLYVLCRTKERAEKRFKEHLKKDYFNLIIQDVCDDYNFNIKFDYIIHTACNAHPLAYSTDPVGVINSNIVGTQKLLEYCRKYGNERFLFLSSSEVYGEANIDEGYKEDSYGRIDPMNVRSCYSESKRMAETIGVAYLKQYNINFLSVRPGHIYGATITEDNSRADAQFLRNVLKKEDIIMKSDGSQIRSYCYVVDCITGILTVLLKGRIGEAYNIGNTLESITIREYAETLAKLGGVKLRFEVPEEKEKNGYTLKINSVLNCEKLKKLTWKNKFNLNRGIERILKLGEKNKKI